MSSYKYAFLSRKYDTARIAVLWPALGSIYNALRGCNISVSYVQLTRYHPWYLKGLLPLSLEYLCHAPYTTLIARVENNGYVFI
jgi:hypothetical protein